jgi:hypothetical protein
MIEAADIREPETVATANRCAQEMAWGKAENDPNSATTD